MRGLPKSIIKKYGVTKKAWRVYRARKGKKRSSKSKRSSNPKKKVKRMAKKKKSRRSGFSANSMFKWIRIGALVGPGAAELMGVTGHDVSHRPAWVLSYYTGYDISDGGFYPDRLKIGWGPYLMAVLTTYGIPKLAGIIRRL